LEQPQRQPAEGAIRPDHGRVASIACCTIGSWRSDDPWRRAKSATWARVSAAVVAARSRATLDVDVRRLLCDCSQPMLYIASSKDEVISRRNLEDLPVTETSTLDEAIGLMLLRHLRHLPILSREGKVLGLLSIRALLEEKVQDLSREVISLEQYMANDGPGG
jgi:hypothetical protein